ncbi:MAG: SUMF1/EgtB/PvdO family nonheme iron enzyme [Paludibacteraceae bacterium]|nr:SUMF1/EgtB/PvdO family nonheme iron enzyme [Paludibacteraceae bacterium]
MRRVLFFIAIFLFTLSSMMGQKIPINLPADGNWPTVVGDSIMIIGPRQNELTEEQRYFNPAYMIVYPGKEHLQAQMIRAGLCDCDLTKPNRRIGVFSVAPDKQVSFSQGNLQYLPAINLWKFANTQYEYLGNANKYLKPTFRNWVDLFGWSANNTTAPFGVSTSMSASDYAGDFVDWGTNWICGDAPNTWRTLSIDEWKYLYHERKNADKLFALGTINGIAGMILLPDDWQLPEGATCQLTTEKGLLWDDNYNGGGYINTNTQANHYQDNIYTLEQWQVMEEAGAVFLPAAGYRENTNFSTQSVNPPSDYVGSYATSTIADKNNYYFMRFIHREVRKYSHSLYRGRAVRLVHDTIVPEVIPEPCMVVKVNDTLSINMMCVEGGTFMMGAMEGDTQVYDNEKPAHEVTLTYNYYIAQTEVTQALWKAVMGNNPSTMIGDDLPVNNVLWEEADAFVKRLSQMTGYTFHLPTEAEWEFAARGGKKSKGYLYAGSDDVNEVAWYANNSGGKTHAVGTKKPNELGIYDMSGNAWEWCSDWLAPYSAEAQVNPIGPATGEYHVYHGGGWNHGQRYARSSHRRTTTEGYIKSVLGLRVAIREKIEPEAVDLGLSVKWANFNIGAFDPTHYGDYFAWGETEPKETYSWATYKWCDGTDANITKYNATDGKTILEPADDAAQVQWGGNWRMPTEEEQQELIDRCRWERITLNGVAGYKVIGPNGNSIFIPIAGAYNSFDNQLNSVGSIGWIYSSTIATEIRAYEIHIEEGGIQQRNCSRCVGLTIRPVYDDRPTLTVIPTPEDAKVSFHCSGYQWAGNSITVDKGKDVLYQVTNVDADYLSQGDSIYKLTKDSVLYVTLRPFSDGNWVKVDNSEYTKQEGYYVSRNKGAFASYSVWNYYVLPVLPGETYRVRSIAGQHAALWIAASTAPDAATNTRPTKISCCANRGVAAYIADEVTIPDGAKYLIINSRNGKEMMVERKVPDPCLVVKVNDTLSINLMCVEGGTFMMGSDAPGAEADEQPVHEVTLSDYYIGQTEVTQKLWKLVMDNNNPSANKGDELPVTNITWDEAQVFVQKLSEMTGLHFRLPTEAEWEYAARGGQKSKGYTYAGSNDIDEVGWYNGNSSNKTHAVGQKQPNELGIYDMTGNVWEYCYDWHMPYSAQAQTNPTGAATGDKHVLRGGCYHYDSKNCTSTNRHSYYTPDKGGASTGLRIVLEP